MKVLSKYKVVVYIRNKLINIKKEFFIEVGARVDFAVLMDKMGVLDIVSDITMVKYEEDTKTIHRGDYISYLEEEVGDIVEWVYETIHETWKKSLRK